MSASLATARRSFTSDPPAFQWDMGRGAGPRVVRLFGHLGERELQHVIDLAPFSHADDPEIVVAR